MIFYYLLLVIELEIILIILRVRMSDRYKRIPDSKEPIEMKQLTMNRYR